MSNPPPAQSKSRLIPWVLLASGLLFLIGGGIALVPGIEARFWPTTEGTIIRHRIETHPSFKLPGYVAVVTYRYRVEGKTYENNRFSNSYQSPGMIRRERAQAEEDYRSAAAFAPYQQGKRVKVFYHPRHPAEAFLHPRDLLLPLGLIGFGLVSLAGAWAEFKRQRRSSPGADPTGTTG